MRPVLALLALLLLAASGSVAVAEIPPSAAQTNQAGGSARSAQSTENATLTGTVTTIDGAPAANATVLVGSRALFEKSSPSELRAMAADDPQDVAVVETDADGRFSVTPGEAVDREAVVALSERGVSRIVPYEPGSVNLTLRSTKALSLRTPSARAEPGGRAVLTFELRNTDDVAVENLRLTLGKLPDGWNVADATAESGTYSEANRTFRWETVEPGERVQATLRVFVGLDAETKTYTLPVFADSATHGVEAGDVSVRVAYPTEEPNTGAVTDGGEGGDDAFDPGVGPLVAVVLAVGVLGVALAGLFLRD